MTSRFSRALAAFVAALAVGAIGACSALASPEHPEWFVKSGGVFKAVTGSMTIKGVWYPTFNLSGEWEAPTECGESAFSGTIGANGSGTITQIGMSNCFVTNGNCSTLVTEGQKLPWRTQLNAVRNELGALETRTSIGEDGNGTPEYFFKCDGSLTWLCPFEPTTKVRNTTGNVGVEGLFDSKSGTQACNFGGEYIEWTKPGRFYFKPPAGTEGIKVE